MKKKLSKNNLKYIILVFIFLIGIGTFLVRESFAMVDTELMVDPIDGGGGGYIPPPLPPPPTVNVYVSASPTSVYSGSSGPTITWSSSGGAASCYLYRSDTGETVRGFAPSDSYYAKPLTVTTTFTVTCTTDMVAYCSGTYKDLTTKVDWNGAPFPWVSGTIGRYGDNCNSCSDAGNSTGYSVFGQEGSSEWIGGTYITDTSWISNFCAENRFMVCLGVRWSNTSNYVRSAYATNSCSGFPQSSCSSTVGCTWHP